MLTKMHMFCLSIATTTASTRNLTKSRCSAVDGGHSDAKVVAIGQFLGLGIYVD